MVLTVGVFVDLRRIHNRFENGQIRFLRRLDPWIFYDSTANALANVYRTILKTEYSSTVLDVIA
jgi:hypothetical protein